MLINNKQDKQNERVVVGYDLGDYFSQMSFCHLSDDEPETFSTVLGGEAYNIPTVLAKRTEVNQWEFGEEALKLGSDECIQIENLVTKALDGVPISVEDYEFAPEDLLALFIKRSLSMLTIIAKKTNIESIVFTVDVLNKQMIEILEHCISTLGFSDDTKVYFQTREESFFSYVIKQPPELWTSQVLMVDASRGYARFMRLEMNRKTVPVVAFIDTQEYPEIGLAAIPKKATSRDAFLARMDLALETVFEELCEGRRFSSVYLIGEIFSGDWHKSTRSFLCKGRRVFQGSNLFSKGACYYAKERYAETATGKEHVYLGNDKLKTNIGMRIIRSGKESYFAVLNAGINWFEAQNKFDIILEEGKELYFILTPLTGKEKKEAKFLLDGYPYRQRKMTRMQVTVDMTSEHRLRIHVKDLGFGEIFEKTGLEWKEEINIE